MLLIDEAYEDGENEEQMCSLLPLEQHNLVHSHTRMGYTKSSLVGMLMLLIL